MGDPVPAQMTKEDRLIPWRQPPDLEDCWECPPPTFDIPPPPPPPSIPCQELGGHPISLAAVSVDIHGGSAEGVCDRSGH